jgi:hypothetical protein
VDGEQNTVIVHAFASGPLSVLDYHGEPVKNASAKIAAPCPRCEVEHEAFGVSCEEHTPQELRAARQENVDKQVAYNLAKERLRAQEAQGAK